MLEARTPALRNRTAPSLRETWSGDPLAAFKREVDRLFDGFFDDAGTEIRTFQPRIDVRESDEHVLIAADLPGVSPDNLDLNVQGDVLTLSGRREESAEDERQGWYRRERVFGQFERAIRLPFEIADDAVEAKYAHGVLHVRVAKPEGHRSRTRRIPITHQGG